MRGVGSSLKRPAFFACALAAGLGLSCATAPASRPGEGTPTAQVPKAAKKPDPLARMEGKGEYFRENAPKLVKASLDNGIPLIIYQDRGRPVRCLRILLSGTPSKASADKPGLEAICLDLMAEGPSSMAAAAMDALLYRTKASIFSDSSNPDYGSFNLVTLESHFDEAYGVFAASFLQPALRQEDFDSVMLSRIGSLKSIEANPIGKIDSFLAARSFMGHPYAVPSRGNLDLSPGIAIEEVKAYIGKSMGAERLCIVAVGDFDVEELKARMNADFGKIARLGDAPPATPRWESHAECYQQAQGTAGESHILGFFTAPGMADQDDAAFIVARHILKSLLFQSIRGRHGLAYAPGTFAFDGESPYAAIFVDKTNDPEKVKALIDSSVQALAAGFSPSQTSDPDALLPLDKTVEGWKECAIAESYAYAGSSQILAARLGEAYLYAGDPAEYFLLGERIAAVSAADVTRVAKQWILNAQVSWAILGGQIALDSVDPEGWKSFKNK